MGIGAIVRDKNGRVMLTMESHFSMISFVELAKALVMFHGLSTTLRLVFYRCELKLTPKFFETSWLGTLNT